MQLTKQEITEELAHQQHMLRVRRERRRVLEIQAAQRGIDTRPEILTEITILNEEIARHECEATQLATQAAEEYLSFAEVEYRMFLAEAWDAAQGALSVVRCAQLELARLKLGLMPERARTLEHEIRAELAHEVLARVNADMIYAVQRYQPGSKLHQDTNKALALIGKALRLDPVVTVEWLARDTGTEPPLSLDRFAVHLFHANKIGRYSAERRIFEQFLFDLAAAHAVHEIIEVYSYRNTG
jgi:hypothetical protein